MRATTLMTIQIISLALIVGCAENFLEETLPSILFVSAFIIFATCSIYIGRHEKEIIRDNNRRHAQRLRASL